VDGSTNVDTSKWAVSVPVGYLLHGWEVIRPLATGGWGSVYECRRAGQAAALKFLPTGTLTPRQFNHLAAMTLREVRSHGELARHPRLITLLETFAVDDPDSRELDGATVIVMDLADRSLAELTGLGKPVPDAPRLITEICEGLAHMHAEGWLHGDLKPSNILLMPDGSIRLADFGLTTELDGSHAYLPRAGSMDYLAPERRSEPMTVEGAAVRVSADIWALGITAYQLLTGSFPFPGTTWRGRAAAAIEYVEGRAPLVLDPGLSEGWRAWVCDCLAPTHSARSRHDARSLLDRAKGLAAGRWRRRWSRRRKVLVSAAAATLTAGVITVPVATGGHPDPTGRWLRAGSDIPPQYRTTIVQAGTAYCHEKTVTPALIAAMLKAESGFNADLSDPAKDEYGIARWTPSILQFYLSPDQVGKIPKPPLDPYESIRAMGRYLCKMAPEIQALHIPGDHQLDLAAAYRSSVEKVASAEGVAPKWQAYIANVSKYMQDYQPR
jgi:serine/threonine protein kinase